MMRDKRRIVCFHSISNDTYSAEKLERFIKAVLFCGYHFVGLQEILECSPSERVLTITFDDGYANNYHSGAVIFKKFSIKPTVFIVTSLVGAPFCGSTYKNHKMYDKKVMDIDDVLRWIDMGFDVGFHTHKHINVYKESILAIEQDFHMGMEIYNSFFKNSDSKFRSFAYPYGYLPKMSNRGMFEKLLQENQFSVGVTTEWSNVGSMLSEYYVPRVVIGDSDSLVYGLAKALGFLDWRYRLKYRAVENAI